MNLSTMCLKVLNLVLFSSSCALLLVSLSFQTHLQIITFMQMRSPLSLQNCFSANCKSKCFQLDVSLSLLIIPKLSFSLQLILNFCYLSQMLLILITFLFWKLQFQSFLIVCLSMYHSTVIDPSKTQFSRPWSTSIL